MIVSTLKTYTCICPCRRINCTEQELGPNNKLINEQIKTNESWARRQRTTSGVWRERLVSQPTQTTVSYALSRGGDGGGGHESVAVGLSGRGATAVAGRT